MTNNNLYSRHNKALKHIKNNLEYIFMSESASYASNILGQERSLIKNNIKRNKG